MITTLYQCDLGHSPVAILGIDSGKAGAWCLLHESDSNIWGSGQWAKMEGGAAGLVKAEGIAIGIINHLSRRPWASILVVHEVPVGEGRTNGHVTFRPAHWIVGAIAACINAPMTPIEIMPNTWQGAFGIGGHMKRAERKKASVEVVSRIYGLSVKADLADAILMATWARDEVRRARMIGGEG